MIMEERNFRFVQDVKTGQILVDQCRLHFPRVYSDYKRALTLFFIKVKHFRSILFLLDIDGSILYLLAFYLEKPSVNTMLYQGLCCTLPLSTNVKFL